MQTRSRSSCTTATVVEAPTTTSMATWCPRAVAKEEFDLVAARVASRTGAVACTANPIPVARKRTGAPGGNCVAPRDLLHRIVSRAASPPYRPALDLFDEPDDARVAAYTSAALAAVRGGAWTPAVCRADASNRFGVTLLHKACRASNSTSVAALLAAGAPPTSCDAGRVPLHDAIWTTDPDFRIVADLVARAPDQLFCEDTRGFTPMDYAPAETWPAWAAFLEERKAMLRKALSGETPRSSPGRLAGSPAHITDPARKCARGDFRRSPSSSSSSDESDYSDAESSAKSSANSVLQTPSGLARALRPHLPPLAAPPLIPPLNKVVSCPTLNPSLDKTTSWPSFSSLKATLDAAPASNSPGASSRASSDVAPPLAAVEAAPAF